MRSDKNIRVTLSRALERLVHGSFSSRAVAVDPTDRRVRKSATECIFEALGTLAERFDNFTALVTVLDQRSAGAAVMAAQLLAARVHSES